MPFSNAENDRAFHWLTAPDTVQCAQLEYAMRNYAYPVYDPADVATHLLRALAAPAANYPGDPTQINPAALAVAIINFACDQGWDIVEEIGTSS